MNKNRLLTVVQMAMVCAGPGVASFPKWSDSQFPNEGQNIQYSERQNTIAGTEMKI